MAYVPNETINTQAAAGQSESHGVKDVGGTHGPEELEVIHLNVGGIRYVTTVATLTQSEHKLSWLYFMVTEGENLLIDKDGSRVIDRDGSVFGHVLNYLRDGLAMHVDGLFDYIYIPARGYFAGPFANATTTRLLRDAKFYNLPGLVKLIHDPILTCSFCSKRVGLNDRSECKSWGGHKFGPKLLR